MDTHGETIINLRKSHEALWDSIAMLQFRYAEKMFEENKEGNLYSAGLYLEIINDLQKIIDR